MPVDDGQLTDSSSIGSNPPASGGAAPNPAAPAAGEPANSPAGPSASATATGAAGMTSPAPISAAAPGHTPDTLHRIYHGVLDTFGGKDDVTYARDPKTGAMVAAKTPRAPGDQWKHILAGALTGAAAGFGVQPGPGSKARAASAGFNTEVAREDKQDQRKREQANEDFDAKQKLMVQQAQVAHLNQETAATAWRLKREGVEFGNELSQARSAFDDLIQQNPENREIGVYGSFQEFLAAHKTDMPNLFGPDGMIARGSIRTFADQDGVHVYEIQPNWLSQKISQPTPVMRLGVDKKNGRPTMEQETAPAGSYTNGEIANIHQKVALDYFTAVDKWETAHRAASENAEADARTKLIKEQTRLLPLGAQRTELQNEIDQLDKTTTALEQANDKDLSSESWMQRHGYSAPPKGVKPRRAFEEQLEARRQAVQAKVDEVLKQMSGAKSPPAAGAKQPPAGATMKVPGSDGKLHWSDGKKDLGLAE